MLKEWVIVLTRDEKRTFYGFYGLFLSSTLILMMIIGWLFYQMQSDHLKDLTISKMKINASRLAARIIYSHMQYLPINRSDLVVERGLHFGLYDRNKKPIMAHISEKIDFSRKLYKVNDKTFLVDTSAAGHLGVVYIVVEEYILKNAINNLIKHISITLGLTYILTSILGFFLARFFITPIQKQREKLDNFIKDTTHELNTPIAALLMCVESPNPTSQKNLTRINLSAKRISEIYKDLTYLILKDKNRSIKQAVIVDLKPMLDEQIDYFKEFASKKKITLEYEAYETFFKIDQDSFTRLTNNLISNAIKYTNMQGKIKILLKNSTLVIEDNGIGIEEKKLKEIFTRFYRATSQNGGFGIGLNIVSSICQSYDIKIDVKSKLNEGTTFTLDFNT